MSNGAKLIWGAAVAAVLVILGIYLYIGDGPGRADASDPVLVAEGEKVYREHCASCHGANLEGQPNWRTRGADGLLPAPPHNQVGHTWHHPDRILFEITRDGPGANLPTKYRTAMPAFGDTLSDRHIWASLAYIKSRWPANIRARQESINRRAR